MKRIEKGSLCLGGQPGKGISNLGRNEPASPFGRGRGRRGEGVKKKKKRII